MPVRSFAIEDGNLNKSTLVVSRARIYKDIDLLEERIIQKIDQYEPRAKVVNVDLNVQGDRHTVRATVTFRIVGTNEEDTIELNLTRLR